jgi:hypothetical protein
MNNLDVSTVVVPTRGITEAETMDGRRVTSLHMVDFEECPRLVGTIGSQECKWYLDGIAVCGSSDNNLYLIGDTNA